MIQLPPGVVLARTQTFRDDRGCLTELFRSDASLWRTVGPLPVLKQTTLTMSYPGVIKAFHWHRLQTDYWTVVSGEAQVVLFDLRPPLGEAQPQALYLSGTEPKVLAIPPQVAHGYRVLGSEPLLLIYGTTELYNVNDPDEWRIAWDDPAIGFDWTTQPR